MHTVVKPFKTLNRRFKVGDPITPADIIWDNLVSFAELKERGMIAETAAEPAAEPAEAVQPSEFDHD
jgi:hypothetical protein